VENNRIGIDRLIKIAQEELVEIEAKRERILKQIEALKSLKGRKQELIKPSLPSPPQHINLL